MMHPRAIIELGKLVKSGGTGEVSRSGMMQVQALFSQTELGDLPVHKLTPERLIGRAVRRKSLKQVGGVQ